MAATFYSISQDEMETFLGERGKFQPLSLSGCNELVYGFGYKLGENRYSIRVYTGINPDGHSRGVGKDAIRVEVYYWDKSNLCPVRVGGSKRVHRVENWRANLTKRLDNWRDALSSGHCSCGAPLVKRKVKKAGPNKGKQFLTCVIKNCDHKSFKWVELTGVF